MITEDFEHLLNDHRLIQRLEKIEEKNSSSENPYDSKDAAITFSRVMWKLAQIETTNPFKEIKLLQDIFLDKDVVQHLRSKEVRGMKLDPDDRRINIIDIGSGNGDKAKTIIKNLDFTFMRYWPIDISLFMGEIALHNIYKIFGGPHQVHLAKKHPEKGRKFCFGIREHIDQKSLDNFVNGARISKQRRLSTLVNKLEDILYIYDDVATSKDYTGFSMFCAGMNVPNSSEEKALENLVLLLKLNPELSKELENSSLTSEGIKRIVQKYAKPYDYATLEEVEDLRFRGEFHKSLVRQRLKKTYDLGKIKIKQLRKIISNGHDLTYIERFFDIYEPLLEYFHDYFNQAEKWLNRREYYALLKSSINFHLEIFEKTFLIDFNQDRPIDAGGELWSSLSCNRNIQHKFLNIMFSGMISTKNKNDFGSEKLEEVLNNCTTVYGLNPLIQVMSKNSRICITPDYCLRFDFTNFNNVYKAIEYFTSHARGLNMFMFLGQTLGNFDEKQRQDLVQKFYNSMKSGDYLLVGVDLRPHQNLSEEAKERRIKEMEWEYEQAESFARLISPKISKDSKYKPKYDASSHKMLINFEHKDGIVETIFSSYKFSYQEVQELFTRTGFRIIGLKPYIPQSKEDSAPEYVVLLCEKPENNDVLQRGFNYFRNIFGLSKNTH